MSAAGKLIGLVDLEELSVYSLSYPVLGIVTELLLPFA